MKSATSRFNSVWLLIVAACLASDPNLFAADWLTLPSTYTHSLASGERINQFATVQAPPLNDQSSLITSGYTHFRSTIQYGQSADNYHRVNQWGPPVRPYGEWEFPYRPYSVPYPAWGAPFAGPVFGGVYPAAGYPGGGYPGGGYPGGGYPGGGYSGDDRLRGGYQGNGYQGGIPGQPFEPYPATPNGAYPAPPWWGGYQPDYPIQAPLNDRQFFNTPSTAPQRR